MKNYMNLRKLYEQETQAITPEATAELGVQPHMEAPMSTEVPALPAEGQSSASPDPMTMTVGDFIARCKELDPLVCMGIESFIQKNIGSFGTSAHAPMAPQETEPDLTFSSQVPDGPTGPTGLTGPMGHMAPPAPVQPFSLDQGGEELNFPS